MLPGLYQGVGMRRRGLVQLMGIATLPFPWPSFAQSNSLPLVGVMFPRSDNEVARKRIAEIRKGLQEVGRIEGTHYSLAVRFANGDLSRVPSLAKELAALNSRLIIVVGYGPSLVHSLLPAMPLVFTSIAGDPISSGYAQSYAHPGGMLTGNVMNALGGEEAITQKRIGLLKQIVPDLKRLGMIAPDPGTGVAFREKDALRIAAAQLGFEFMHYGLRTLDDLESAFASGRRDNVSAFYISGEPLLISNISRVMTFVEAARKPTVGPNPDWGWAGLLMSYSTDPAEGFHRAGVYAAKILNGAVPGDLPIEQASKFTMVINQKTAAALGIVIPPTVLALADEVIE
jgi:putative tryptophan/tyrosine transport system substrate-binding protein